MIEISEALFVEIADIIGKLPAGQVVAENKPMGLLFVQLIQIYNEYQAKLKSDSLITKE